VTNADCTDVRSSLAEAAPERGQALHEVHVMTRGRPAAHRLLGLTEGGAGVTPYPIALVLEQTETEDLLLKALAGTGIDVEWDTRLTDVAQDADGVDLTLAGPGGAQERARADWVVGADGASSRVRERLGLASRARPTGRRSSWPISTCAGATAGSGSGSTSPTTAR
jgi:2-polyprenyl-6-methoxyphenol hydroxylase-like FAD-dependent oxidoreductase